MSKYEFHPLTNIFPVMPDHELHELAADIRKQGQEEPVILWNGQIIDGRNRALAVAIIDREDNNVGSSLLLEDRSDFFNQDSSDLIQWLITKNLRRRHLNESQRAMVAVRVKEFESVKARERQRIAGKQHGEGHPQSGIDVCSSEERGNARDLAGKHLNVSGRSVDCAEKVTKRAIPELREAVQRGKVSVSSAAVIADQPPGVQRKAVAGGKQGVVQAAKQVKEQKRQQRKFDLARQSQLLRDTIDQLLCEWPKDRLVIAFDLIEEVIDIKMQQFGSSVS